MSAGCRVGLDLGGTGTRAVAVVDGSVVATRDVLTASLGEGSAEERIEALAALVETVATGGLVSVGIGASGPVDIASGIIHNSATLPWFSEFPLTGPLAERLGVRVTIDNDAVAAALGELHEGAGEGVDRMLMVTLGTGIGVAMLVGGAPVRGRNLAHPEGGHIPISSDPEPCYCGLSGCWEHLASRGALQRALATVLGAEVPPKDLIAVGLQRAQHDASVMRVFEAYAALVGRGLGALHTLFQPAVTVIGGSAALALPALLPTLQAGLRRSPDFAVDVEIRVAALGDAAGAVGAALAIAE